MKIALIGNQNSGKTTLFNLLTGSNQKVGNWPGVTISWKSGVIKGTDYELIDLPGVYSLSPYSNEEKISRNYVLEEDLDCIINIIDVTSLERSLYLTTQLLELDTKVIVVLNMSDMLEKKKITINEKKLAKKLGCPVVSVSALRNTGTKDLIDAINSLDDQKGIKIFDSYIEDKIDKVNKIYTGHDARFISIKLIEKDPFFEDLLDDKIRNYIADIEHKYKMDAVEVIASGRYDFIEEVKEETFEKEAETKLSFTDRIDKIILNKYLGIPIFIIIMFFVFYISVGKVGEMTVEYVEDLIESLKLWTTSSLISLGASNWSSSLVVDGIMSGVGAVLAFIPQLTMLFIFISFLESSGYMSRISFLLDKIFRKFGLSGKSLIPFIVGMGCTVPAIMATRTIADENERKITISVTPFIPCSAKLPVIALFASNYFFGSYYGFVAASLYFSSIIVIIITAILLRKFVFKGTSTGYITELPNYRLPSFRYTVRDVGDRVYAFIKKAGTVILFSSVIIWFLISFSFRFEYGIDPEYSMLAIIGKGLSWIFYPMLGEMSWGASFSAIQGLVAKEQVISSMEIISGITSDAIFEYGSIFAFFTPASAYAFTIFNLFSAPCIGTIGAMKKEYGSGKAALYSILFQTAFAWLLAVIVFQIGRLLI